MPCDYSRLRSNQGIIDSPTPAQSGYTRHETDTNRCGELTVCSSKIYTFHILLLLGHTVRLCGYRNVQYTRGEAADTPKAAPSESREGKIRAISRRSPGIYIFVYSYESRLNWLGATDDDYCRGRTYAGYMDRAHFEHRMEDRPTFPHTWLDAPTDLGCACITFARS